MFAFISYFATKCPGCLGIPAHSFSPCSMYTCSFRWTFNFLPCTNGSPHLPTYLPTGASVRYPVDPSTCISSHLHSLAFEYPKYPGILSSCPFPTTYMYHVCTCPLALTWCRDIWPFVSSTCIATLLHSLLLSSVLGSSSQPVYLPTFTSSLVCPFNLLTSFEYPQYSPVVLLTCIPTHLDSLIPRFSFEVGGKKRAWYPVSACLKVTQILYIVYSVFLPLLFMSRAKMAVSSVL